MFKLIVIVFIVFIVLSLLYFILLKKKQIKIYYSEDKIKYEITPDILNFFKKLDQKINLKDLNLNDFFYTTVKWNTKNNNYIIFNDRYYIIEPGYYYQYIGKMVVNNNILVNKITKNVLILASLK